MPPFSIYSVCIETTTDGDLNMAYMNQERKKELAPAIKAVLKKYNMKGTIGVNNHSTLVVNIKSGVIDFGGTYIQVNNYHIDRHYEGIARVFLNELNKVMMTGNHNNSDVMSDYFDVGWYVNINIGAWDKPYIPADELLLYKM